MKRSMQAIMMIGILLFGASGMTVFNAAPLNSINVSSQSENKITQRGIGSAEQAKSAAINKYVKAYQAIAPLEKAAKEAAARAERPAQVLKVLEQLAREAERTGEELPDSMIEQIEEARKEAQKTADEADRAAAAVEGAKEAAQRAWEEAINIVRVRAITRAEIERATNTRLTASNVNIVLASLTYSTVWETLGFTSDDAVKIADRVLLVPEQTREILRSMSKKRTVRFQVTIVDNTYVTFEAVK